MVMRLAEQAETLRALHVPGSPLVLPNAWDAASARLVEEAGFATVATSSGAVARSLGYEDGGGMPPDEAFAAVARIARATTLPVTADVEDGYGLEARELVERLLEAGAVGCNLEDSDHRGGEGPLVPAEQQAERIASVKDAARAAQVDVVVNARVDVHLRRVGREESRLDEALRRARLYADAGADCVFPIMVFDDETIRALVAGVDAPVNVLARVDAAAVPRLAALGVARISFGSGLAAAAVEHLRGVLAGLR